MGEASFKVNLCWTSNLSVFFKNENENVKTCQKTCQSEFNDLPI